jgi:hypothetical protein
MATGGHVFSRAIKPLLNPALAAEGPQPRCHTIHSWLDASRSALTCSTTRPKIPLFPHARALIPTIVAPEEFVSDWRFAQKFVSEELAELHLFSFKKCVSGVEIDFTITVKEFAAPPPGQHFRFFAQADKLINQKVAPFIASGWGNSILDALAGCTRAIREFPCEPDEAKSTETAAGA